MGPFSVSELNEVLEAFAFFKVDWVTVGVLKHVLPDYCPKQISQMLLVLHKQGLVGVIRLNSYNKYRLIRG